MSARHPLQRRRTLPTDAKLAACVDGLPELHSGDRMTRKEFHRIYEQMPPDFKAELVGGTVYVASPLKRGHGLRQQFLGALFAIYVLRTRGVECSDNTTVLLGDEGEPQPDN